MLNPPWGPQDDTSEQRVQQEQWGGSAALSSSLCVC